MIDSIATAPAPAGNTAGVTAMSRLAERLTAVAPTAATASLASPPAPSFSPAVTAALSRSAAMSASAAGRAQRSRSFVGRAVDSFISACSFIPYSVVALALRLVMARLLFLDGQARVNGPRFGFNIHGFDLSAVLPLHVKLETITTFFTKYVALPLPAVPAAYVLSFAEFILPICLVLGLGTRFVTLILLCAIPLIHVYVMPQAFWSLHIYWAAILLVLLAHGAGQISLDRVIRFVARR
ncbi:MAG: DoxX family protein [Pseudolabrys sp.]